MIYLILVGASLLLFGGFLVFAAMEARTQTRFLRAMREGWDRRAAQFFFIVEHVNWSEFLSHTLRGIGVRILHDTAHVVLQVVRFIERQLTRAVRYFRDRRPNVLAPKPSRQSFVTTTKNYISDHISRKKSDETAEG